MARKRSIHPRERDTRLILRKHYTAFRNLLDLDPFEDDTTTSEEIKGIWSLCFDELTNYRELLKRKSPAGKMLEKFQELLNDKLYIEAYSMLPRHTQ